MANDFGLRVGVDGESEFKRALSEINASMKTLGTEAKLVQSQYEKNDKGISALTSRNEILNKQMQVQTSKINLLKDALANAEQKYGSNSKQVQQWKQKLNLAEAELNDMKREVANNEKAIEETTKAEKEGTDAVEKYGKETKEAGEKSKNASSAFSSLGNVVKKVGAAFAVAAAAAAAGAAAIIKNSIEQYSEYEQLVGGVETLFKDSNTKVVGYANDAYKSAGISANEYMSTVTSFSASLLQGLEGDTETAAEIANKAVIDMSDNANKMGTDMSSIMSAYQGFAKQNYTMLDNLKLGYGGTAAEMARLINDSGVLGDAMEVTASTVKDVSFDKVIEAIHVVQTEMGITGTTAKEASTTIQGSLKSLSSAWTNLVGGMADENANVDQLITNFVDSVETAAENLLPRITIAIEGMIQVIEKLLPQIADMIPKLLPTVMNGMMTLVNGIVQALPTIIDTILGVLPQLVQGLIGMLPNILTAIKNIVGEVLKLLPDLIEMVITAVGDILPDIVYAIADLIPLIMDAVMTITDRIVAVLPGVIEKIVAELPKLIPTLVRAIVGTIPSLLKAVIAITDGIVKALPDIIVGIIEALPDILLGIVDVIIDLFPAILEGVVTLVAKLIESLPKILIKVVEKLYEFGGDIVNGLVEGIKDKFSKLKNKVGELFGGFVDGVKDFFGIHSPSKVFENIGTNLGLGLEDGFVNTMKDAEKEIQNSVPTNFSINGKYGTSELKYDTFNQQEELSLMREQNLLLQHLVEKNLNITIGDDTIGKANARYVQNRGVILNKGVYANAY